jgi:hypothetical protein
VLNHFVTVPIRTPVMRFAARTESVEALTSQLNELSRERQELRAGNADAAALEQNRIAIVEAQWALSRALIDRYLPPGQRAA